MWHNRLLDEIGNQLRKVCQPEQIISFFVLVILYNFFKCFLEVKWRDFLTGRRDFASFRLSLLIHFAIQRLVCVL